MFRIGDFSRIARVSARLLRFYDEIGLLAPARADPCTGYRYYTIAQLPMLNRITVLKELGFSLEQIADLLKSPPDASELRRMLLLRRNDVARTLADETRRLRRIETRIAQIEVDGALSVDDVIERSEPARRILSLRRRATSFADARELFSVLQDLSRPLLPTKHSCQLVVIAHAQHFEMDDLDVELGYAVEKLDVRSPTQTSELALRELPEVARMAVCVRVGLPEDAHAVTGKIGRFIAANGDALDGPSREVFLQAPDPHHLDQSVVEMQFPICKLRDEE